MPRLGDVRCWMSGSRSSFGAVGPADGLNRPRARRRASSPTTLEVRGVATSTSAIAARYYRTIPDDDRHRVVHEVIAAGRDPSGSPGTTPTEDP
jgi:hypothetical protein